MPKVIPVFASVLAAAGILTWKAPHIRLAAQLASGEIDGRPVPVVDFVPVRFHEETISVRCGDLVFDVPRSAVVKPTSADECSSLVVELDGLRCRIFPPRHEYSDQDRWLDTQRCAGALGHDEVSRQGAICAASEQDFSFWMSAADVELLRARLEVRPVFCVFAERVEVVREKRLSGLLRFSVCEGQTRMDLEYFSPDNRTRGRAFLFADGGSEQMIRAGRALVSTFRLEPDCSGPTR